MMEATKTVVCKLRVGEEEAEKIKKTAVAFREATNYISEIAFQKRCFNPVALHHMTYRDVREKFGLTANLAVRARDRVSKSYKINRHRQHKFRQLSIDLDRKLFTLFRNGEYRVSIATIDKRVKSILGIGDYQRELLKNPVRDAKIIFKNGEIYFHITVICQVPGPEGINPIGVDIGEKKILVASNGFSRGGGSIEDRRREFREQRRALQRVGTPSAKRKLKRLGRKESRWINTTMHQISREFVNSLKRGDIVVLEDLTGIREKVKRRRTNRADFHSWAFAKLSGMIEYKCAERGIPVERVNPKFTSQRCPRCGTIDKRNRRNQALFRCIRCGFQDNADHVASINLRERALGVWALVNVPMVGMNAVPKSFGSSHDDSPTNPPFNGG